MPAKREIPRRLAPRNDSVLTFSAASSAAEGLFFWVVTQAIQRGVFAHDFAIALIRAHRHISLVKIWAQPQMRFEITACPARHKARALRSDGPRTSCYLRARSFNNPFSSSMNSFTSLKSE